MFCEKKGLKKLLLLQALIGGGSPAVERIALGNPLTFGTDLAKPLVSLEIPFTPKQEGSGDPSPENIRSIIPWNGLKVFGGGKNLLNPANRVASGNNVQYYRSGNRFLLKGGQTYTLSANVIPAQTTMYKGTNTTVASTTSASLTYTPTENVEVWFDFYVPNARLPEGGISAVYGMLEVGATATAYEPYKPITETDIPFPSPVYGGEHEAVSGAMTEKWYCLKKKWSEGENPAVYENFTRKSFRFPVPVMGVNGSYFNGQLCNMAKLSWDTYQTAHFYIDTSVAYIWLPNDTDGNTEIQFASRLVTPQEQTLTGHQITALVGDNTIWSDADGSMTAGYLVSSKYADEHPVGGLGFGFGFGSGSDPDEPDDPENPDEPEEPIIDDSENNQTEGEEP